jgi:beta-lactamase class A
VSTTTAVEAQLQQIFSDAGATGFVHAKQVGTDDGAQVCLNAESPVVLASVFKILVATAFAEEVAAGRLDPLERATVTARYRIGGIGTAGFADDTTASLRDLALNMMSFSDNAATDVIYHRLGHERVGEVAPELGLSDTALIGCCEDLFATVMEDLGVTSGADPDEALENATEEQVWALRALDAPQTSHSTPRDITTLLEAIWTDRAASPAACATVRELMGKQIWPHRLSSGFDQDGITIAAKTGTLPSVRNEAGVVTYPDGASYAVAVFTRADDLAERLPRVDASIGLAARAAVDYLRS